MEEPQRAIVFVHGFFGNARTTWRAFQRLADEVCDDWWAQSDLYFYCYDSWSQSEFQAQDFREFLKDVLQGFRSQSYVDNPPPASLYDRRSADKALLNSRKEYRELLIVGHSTGGVIVRQAVVQLMDAYSNTKSSGPRASISKELPKPKVGLLDASLRLFAPANCGAICSGRLAIAGNAPVSEIILALILRSRPLFENIREGSTLLERLRSNTEAYFEQFPAVKALTAHSLFGKDEAIVTADKYDCDRRCRGQESQSHTTICKPSRGFDIPMKFVKNPKEFVDNG